MTEDIQESKTLQETLDQLGLQAEQAIAAATSTAELSQIEIEYLGRKGKLTELLRRIGELPKEERPSFGQRANTLRDSLTQAIAERRQVLETEERERRLREEAVDVTLPGRLYRVGRRHPLSTTVTLVKQIFIGMGFEVVEGPEVEQYLYNFDVLNYPEDHPAMDAQMSFYITDELLLRTQTTAIQGRVMETRLPPFRICTVGRCFRYDAMDATHSHTFHQVDCFMVDEGISMADLKGTLTQFSVEMFGSGTKVRFRPDYFPFVEPGAEWAITCFACKGSGCTLCKNSGWLELGGAGMIHPNILERFGIDSEKYTGFAFGMGIERMPMLQYGIDDLRLFLENDLRFLRQF
ncbi:MAG: phenylalanine--tRNA ligase subunit alpha [Armatimonadetes bacterium]|nr:phenylalanine--tRNA ligase subunit alpha [Armatimonadota bacterium]